MSPLLSCTCDSRFSASHTSVCWLGQSLVARDHIAIGIVVEAVEVADAVHRMVRPGVVVVVHLPVEGGQPVGRVVAVRPAIRAGQPTQPVIAECVAGRLLGQSADVAKAVVGVAAAQALAAALAQAHLQALQHPAIALDRPRIKALRAPQPAGRRQPQRGHAPGLVEADLVHQVAVD